MGTEITFETRVRRAELLLVELGDRVSALELRPLIRLAAQDENKDLREKLTEKREALAKALGLQLPAPSWDAMLARVAELHEQAEDLEGSRFRLSRELWFATEVDLAYTTWPQIEMTVRRLAGSARAMRFELDAIASIVDAPPKSSLEAHVRALKELVKGYGAQARRLGAILGAGPKDLERRASELAQGLERAAAQGVLQALAWTFRPEDTSWSGVLEGVATLSRRHFELGQQWGDLLSILGLTSDKSPEDIVSHVRALNELAKEVCICAAIRLLEPDGRIFRGHRHGDAIRKAAELPNVPSPLQAEQGFITSRGRFVGREEGYRLQIAAGVASAAEGGYRGEQLYSEDLY